MREAGLADSAYSSIRRVAASEALGRSEKFILAISALDLRRFAEAESLLRSIIPDQNRQSVPTYSEASSASGLSGGLAPAVFESRVYYNLALAQAGRGEIDSAIVYLKQVVKSDPGLSEGWTNLGSALYTKGDYVRAIDAFERARQLTAESEVILFNLALSYFASGNRNKARETASECIRLYPGFMPAKQLLDSINSGQK